MSTPEETISSFYADKVWELYMNRKAVVEARTQRVDYQPALELQPLCNHEWKLYIGFRSVFEYCTRCEDKRDAT